MNKKLGNSIWNQIQDEIVLRLSNGPGTTFANSVNDRFVDKRRGRPWDESLAVGVEDSLKVAITKAPRSSQDTAKS